MLRAPPSRRPMPRAIWARTSSASGFDLRARTSTAARAPTSAARRPGCSSRWKGKRGYPAHQAAVPGGRSGSSAARRSSTTSKRWLPCPGSSSRARDGYKAIGQPNEPRDQALQRERPRQEARRLRAADWAPRAAVIDEHCGGMLDGKQSQGRDPRRLVGADPDAATKAIARTWTTSRCRDNGSMLGSGGIIVCDGRHCMVRTSC